MHISVPPLRYAQIIEQKRSEESSVIRLRVSNARQKQHQRFKKAKSNSEMSAREVREFCPLDSSCQQLLQQAIELGSSARACDRLVRVARTIADLAEEPTITRNHLLEAIGFRQLK
jgi:magnesium chelatase family protein